MPKTTIGHEQLGNGLRECGLEMQRVAWATGRSQLFMHVNLGVLDPDPRALPTGPAGLSEPDWEIYHDFAANPNMEERRKQLGRFPLLDAFYDWPVQDADEYERRSGIEPVYITVLPEKDPEGTAGVINMIEVLTDRRQKIYVGLIGPIYEHLKAKNKLDLIREPRHNDDDPDLDDHTTADGWWGKEVFALSRDKATQTLTVVRYAEDEVPALWAARGAFWKGELRRAERALREGGVERLGSLVAKDTVHIVPFTQRDLLFRSAAS